ncbi:MAG: efflux RND transporter permease subunit [Syntrophaceae bacterium]|nr:efflux RND transporter permease subunit [Syntrophaceae bacterium]
MSKFFLARPVFAWVIAIIIMAWGLLAIYNLPVSQYPEMAPPTISITASYTGASAETVENSVTQIIEQKMTGFDNLLYMSATSDSAGSSRIELTFAPGTNPDVAWSQVQNKLQLALTSLPETVQSQGVQVSKSTRNYLMMVGLVSEDGRLDGIDLRDYAKANLEKVIARVQGVGEVEVFGSGYAMRIWLNPDRLTEFRLTVEDVLAALKAYNVEVSAGQLGGAPAVEGQRLNASIVVQNMLKTPEEFAAIPIRINPDGSAVRIRDVGRTELGTDIYDINTAYNGMPVAGIAIRQAAGANALDTADNVKAKMAELSQFFPAGLKVVYPYDTTPYIRVAIGEVVKTLFEAVFLVFLIMWLFLGSLRATLIPTLAVPVVLLGTFGVLGLFGFSINMLTMFAMVLAIGLLVDDAIIVVENVERIMAEEGLPPREATAKSMKQITSALIGIGLVLSAVFGPMAFFPGSTGVIYRQFSVTIIAAMLLSVVVALILTPVLCASLLKPVKEGDEAGNTLPFLRPFFHRFNALFSALRRLYVKLVNRSLVMEARYVVIFLVLVAAMAFLFMRMPTAYLPDEDQGLLLAQVIMPKGATIEQTTKVTDEIMRYFNEHEQEAVETCLTITGIGFSGRSQNNGMVFVKLRDWELRNRADLRDKAVAGRSTAALSQTRNAMVFVFPPPAVPELATALGFDLRLLNRGDFSHERFKEILGQLLGIAAQDQRVTKVRPNMLEDVSEYRVDVDWDKAGALGVPISSIHRTIAATFGSAYANDFIQGGQVKRVFVQADAHYRMLPQDIDKLYVRNNQGRMVPFSAFASGRWISGPPQLSRYNGFPAISIWGEPVPGRSSGEAMQAMEEAIGKLPQGTGFDWTGLSYQERQSGNQALILYAFSIFVIFLCLAALYESWTIPISILLVLPLGVIGGVIASSMRGMANDVYFQIALLTTLGLTTKNAILIAQFAKSEMEQGMGLIEATVQGAKLRFRPIIMTSLAFAFGVLPMAITAGAGAGAQNAIGTGVLGGMVTATLLVVIFCPLFFVLIEKFFGRHHRATKAAPASQPVKEV